jgi:CTP:molybdopterin cytidylyltransferase MocA
MGSSKALLPFGPETMLQRVVRLLGGVVSPIVAVAAIDQMLPDLPPAVIVTRDEHQGRGPLEGLRAGLKALPADVDAAYVTSCDVPLLVPGFVRQMVDLAEGHDIAVIEIDGFAHRCQPSTPRDAGAYRGSTRARSPAARVSLRRGQHAPYQPRADDRRSGAANAPQPQYA